MPFKKGQKTHNAYPIGFERDNGNGYMERKIAGNEWKKLHVIIWENHYGPLPKSCKILFADGNKRNYNIENLVCLSHAEVMIRNSLTSLPLELRRTIQTLRKLKKQINNGT